ncbi:MAG: hypothetical protein HY673_11120 [Chloroflexi bacterium]|nr:hypothetical protein [Chloroflexota bacterium]
MNKRPIISVVTLLAVFLAGALVATVVRPVDAPASGKTVSAPPTPSMFDPSATPAPRRTVAPRPSPTPSLTPPTSPALAPRTPPPPTPEPTPRPQFFTLNLRTTNPELGNVAIDPPSEDNRYEKGTSVSLYATPSNGYKFNGWTGDIFSPSNSASFVMDSNKRIQAEFEKLSFPVDLKPMAGGTVTLTPPGKAYDHGATVTAKAVPDKGYVFRSWTGDAWGVQNPVTISMDRQKSIGAEFVKGEYRLSLKTSGTGFIDASPSGLHLEGGTVVTLAARPADRYRFDSWSGDASGATRTITVTMDADKAITARFVRLYNLTTMVNPSGAGTVTPSTGIYDDGTEVTLTATPYPGWQFVEWAGNATGGSSTIIVPVNWDKAVMATFVPLP